MIVRNVVVTQRHDTFTVRYFSHCHIEGMAPHIRGMRKGEGGTVRKALDRSDPNAEERGALEVLLECSLKANVVTEAWLPPADDCPECGGSGLLATDYEFGDGANIPLPVNNSTLKMRLCYCLRRFGEKWERQSRENQKSDP